MKGRRVHDDGAEMGFNFFQIIGPGWKECSVQEVVCCLLEDWSTQMGTHLHAATQGIGRLWRGP